MKGVTINSETLALEVIDETRPGGDYLAAEHTLKHFREYWEPGLMSRQRMEEWVEDGKKRMGDRLREKTIAIMEEHRPEPLPENVRTEIDYILREQNESRRNQ
jgi:trimethylamine--corrinoid protein Co-methyltransferase